MSQKIETSVPFEHPKIPVSILIGSGKLSNFLYKECSKQLQMTGYATLRDKGRLTKVTKSTLAPIQGQ